MPRPRNPNPQPKKYIVKQKLKNGGYHVLERTTVFDPDRRQMKVLECTYKLLVNGLNLVKYPCSRKQGGYHDSECS